MTKSQLILAIAKQNKMTRAAAERVVNGVFEELQDTFVRGERVEFRGFGSFQVKEYSGYKGRNPRTGGSVQVPPRRRIRFRMSDRMFDRLNRLFQD